MQNVIAMVVWAFAGVLAAVALLLIGILQLALVAILAAGGYLLASVGVPVYCFICGGAMFLSMAIFLMGKPFSAAK